MPSIVGKRRGKQTYYYLVESARVDGKPRIVSQEYLGTAEEVMARLQGSGAGEPDRSQHKAFGDVAAVWGMLKRLQVADIIADVVGDRRADAAASARRTPTTSSVMSATCRRFSIPHTAATSPNALCWLRSGSPAPLPCRRAMTSSAVPRYSWDTMRGLPSTRADSTR